MLFSPGIDIALAALLGLLIGSFLNVVVYRLPRMMERQWAAECAAMAPPASEAFVSTMPSPPAVQEEKFNLLTPRSRCPGCGRAIRWYENVPVVSWIALRGRCAGCGKPIGLRYPAVEIATAALFAFCASRWGITPTGMAWAGFATALLTLGLIDWDTTLLPDDITLPLLWAGLLVSVLRWTPVALPDAVWGAAAGYLSLWSIYWIFKLLTGKEGMGYGDFKLFAALGAWFGWEALVPLILMASVVGAVVGIAMKMRSSLREGGYVPFGPFLAAAGLGGMAFGPDWVLRIAGF